MSGQRGRGRGSRGSGPQGARRTRPRQLRGEPVVGRRFEVEVGPVAHGGFCVARHEGRAVFVRHAIPGERVVVEVTEGGSEDRFWRADAVEVLTASPHRVEPPCRYAGPGGCGGCDWQHVTPEHQRELKTEVVVEQLERIANLEIEPGTLAVEPLADEDGLRYRTRLELAVDDDGVAGLREHRSRRVVPVADCLLVTDPVARSEAFDDIDWRGYDSVVVADTGDDDAVLVPAPAGQRPPATTVTQEVTAGGRTHRFAVDAAGFWQAHADAPRALVESVLDLARPEEGLRALDLYCGVGLFTAPLASAVGASGSVIAVEGDGVAAGHAEANLAGFPAVEVVHGDVAQVLADLVEDDVHVDLVVLDPPRAGAGREVVERVVDLAPDVVVHVACDPASLARDVALFEGSGYALVDLRALDTFPMTHHVECVALLVPGDETDEEIDEEIDEGER